MRVWNMFEQDIPQGADDVNTASSSKSKGRQGRGRGSLERDAEQRRPGVLTPSLACSLSLTENNRAFLCPDSRAVLTRPVLSADAATIFPNPSVGLTSSAPDRER